jgi:maltose O-acetyltransferase
LNRIINAIQALPFIPRRTRRTILRWSGIKVGHGVTLFSQIFFGSNKCSIGDDCFISVQCLIDGSDVVKIGKNVYLAMGVKLITSSHQFGPSRQRAGPGTKAPITIGDGSWLGASTMVLPGVEIANGCIIGAGSVVVQNTKPNGLYVGVPAKRIKDLDP